MNTIKTRIVAFIYLLLALPSIVSYACPCGCGVSSPLLLGEGERFRLLTYSKLETSSGFLNLESKQEEEWGPSHFARLGVAFAWSPAANFSLSIDLPISTNYHQDVGYDSSLADPSITLRRGFSAWHTLDLLFTPGISVSYKQVLAKSMGERPEKERNLDIHSNGANETKLIFDLDITDHFWGLFGSGGFFQKLKKQVDWGEAGAERHFGLGTFLQLTVYRSFIGERRLSFILEHEQKQADRIGFEEIVESKSKSHLLGVGLQERVGAKKTVGLLFSRKGFAGVDYMTKQVDSGQISFSQTL